MTKWGADAFELRYFYDKDIPGLEGHRFMFDPFDFLSNHTIILLDSFRKSNNTKVSEFKIIVNRYVVVLRFIKIRKMFGREKIIITVSYDIGFCKEMKKSVRVKSQSRAELNEWINGCLDDITKFNNLHCAPPITA